MTTLTQQQVDTLRDVCYTTETKLRAYSGRAMFGEVCLGIVVDGPNDILRLVLELHSRDAELAELLANKHCRMDGMGRDSDIIYWDYVNLKGTDLDYGDEEED